MVIDMVDISVYDDKITYEFTVGRFTFVFFVIVDDDQRGVDYVLDLDDILIGGEEVTDEEAELFDFDYISELAYDAFVASIQ